MKRLADIIASFAGLIVFSPIMLAVAAVVVVTSKGGAIYRQQRLGRFEQPFTCYKFRTMAVGAPVAGTHLVAASWVTPVGKWLRATKLDELPQFYNVLRGDMSLVGPRPCLPDQHEVIAARRRYDVFAIRPGITGRAQLAGIDMSAPDELAFADAAYLKSQSLMGDLSILLRTVLRRGKVAS